MKIVVGVHLDTMQYKTYLNCRVPRVINEDGKITTIEGLLSLLQIKKYSALNNQTRELLQLEKIFLKNRNLEL